MHKNDIIAIIAKDKVVEDIITNCQVPLQYKDDIAQMVYLILLETDEEKIIGMYERDELRFYITRIVLNNYNSKTSPFHKTYRKYERMAIDISDLADKI